MDKALSKEAMMLAVKLALVDGGSDGPNICLGLIISVAITNKEALNALYLVALDCIGVRKEKARQQSLDERVNETEIHNEVQRYEPFGAVSWKRWAGAHDDEERALRELEACRVDYPDRRFRLVGVKSRVIKVKGD